MSAMDVSRGCDSPRLHHFCPESRRIIDIQNTPKNSDLLLNNTGVRSEYDLFYHDSLAVRQMRLRPRREAPLRWTMACRLSIEISVEPLNFTISSSPSLMRLYTVVRLRPRSWAAIGIRTQRGWRFTITRMLSAGSSVGSGGVAGAGSGRCAAGSGDRFLDRSSILRARAS